MSIETKLSPDIQLSDALAQEVERAQAGYLAYLNSLAPDLLPLLFKIDMTDVGMSPGRLSVLALPFWVGETFSVELETQRQIALANIFGLLHFVAQDRLIDGDFKESEIPMLVLSSTLYQQQMFSLYQSYFPPHSNFWSLLNKYWLEWAESTAWERQVGLCPAFVEEDLERAARKAAPLKICTSGLALLGKRDHLISDLERAVDMMHMVMQMTDDLVDMADDLAGDRFNTAVSLMVSRGTLEQHSNLTIEQIGRAMFASGDDIVYFQKMGEIAEQAQELLVRLDLIPWADLILQTAKQAITWRDLVVKEFIPTALEQLFSGSSD